MSIARLGHRPCLSALHWTRFPSALGPATQIRGAKTKTVRAKPAAPRNKQDEVAMAAEKGMEMSLEEQLNQIEKHRRYAAHMPLVDMWGQDTITFDLILPYKTKWTSWADFKVTILDRIENWVKNFLANWTLAAERAIPGVRTSGVGAWIMYTRWPFRAMKTASTKPDTWLAPLRSIVLDSYTELNKAVAMRDERQAKVYSRVDYQADTLDRVAKLPSGSRCHWTLHKELAPVQILSIRATPGHFGAAPPAIGNRYVVQALCRIETEQSLEIYDATGKALHTLEDGAVHVPGKRVPAQRRRVLEYLVIEKKMFYDQPWYFREQWWPKADRQVKT